jgi:hypothetical protein
MWFFTNWNLSSVPLKRKCDHYLDFVSMMYVILGIYGMIPWKLRTWEQLFVGNDPTRVVHRTDLIQPHHPLNDVVIAPRWFWLPTGHSRWQISHEKKEKFFIHCWYGTVNFARFEFSATRAAVSLYCHITQIRNNGSKKCEISLMMCSRTIILYVVRFGYHHYIL